MKRANGEGCIRQRKNGIWEGIVTTGRDPGTGKLIRKSYFGKTQAEVRKKLTALSHDLDEGTYLEPSRMTVGQWMDVWHREYLGGVKPYTVSQYGTQIKVHLKPALGATRLQLLTAPMIQSMYNSELRNGLSAKSIRNLHGVLHKALSQAMKLEYIRNNPCDACELPRIEKHEIKPLEGDYVNRFLQEISGSRFETLYIVTLFTGMRQGEILGLTWDCVNFKNSTINIRRQLQKERIEGGGGMYHFVPLKNDKERMITLAPSVFALLSRHGQRQNEWRLRAGELWNNPLNLVFTDETGHHLYSHTVFENFKRIVKQIGLGGTRFHDLRHTYATLAIQNGDDIKTVSHNLGHATVAFTLDVYGHVTEKMKEESAARMEAYIHTMK
jgi:integrase